MHLRKMIATLMFSFTAASLAQSVKPRTFDVVSIKPSQPGENWHFGFGPTGYSAAGVSLGVMVLQAYFPFNMAGRESLVGAPDWVWNTTWDVEAKMAPEDMAAYQAAPTPFRHQPDRSAAPPGHARRPLPPRHPPHSR